MKAYYLLIFLICFNYALMTCNNGDTDMTKEECNSRTVGVEAYGDSTHNADTCCYFHAYAKNTQNGKEFDRNYCYAFEKRKVTQLYVSIQKGYFEDGLEDSLGNGVDSELSIDCNSSYITSFLIFALFLLILCFN